MDLDSAHTILLVEDQAESVIVSSGESVVVVTFEPSKGVMISRGISTNPLEVKLAFKE
jgi:hypothetical protein